MAVVCDARCPVERRPAPSHVLLVDGRRPLLNQELCRLQLQTTQAQGLLEYFDGDLVWAMSAACWWAAGAHCTSCMGTLCGPPEGYSKHLYIPLSRVPDLQLAEVATCP